MSNIFIKFKKDYHACNDLDKNIQIGPYNTKEVVGTICMNHGVDLIYLAQIIGFSTPTIMEKN